MQWQDKFRRARAEWMLLTFYERFEQVVIRFLTNGQFGAQRLTPLAAEMGA